MKTFVPRRLLIPRVVAMLFSTVSAFAAHPFLCTDSNGNKVALVSVEGAVEWEFSCKHPQDCWALANGNFLFCHEDGAIEMTRDHTIVWEYKAGPDTQVHSCQPLPEGRVLIVENGPSRLIEVDRAGKIAKEIKLTPPPARISVHDQFRGVRKTTGGHYLVCRKGEHRVEELDGEGMSLRLVDVPGDVHDALLLPDGHLLVTCGDGHKVVEYDEALRVVWELNEHDVPGNTLRLMAGVQRLPNGNTVFCNYLGHGHVGEQPHLFELTRDKQVVWSFADHTHFKTINQIQLLDVPGDPSRGEILR
ncbi:MAG: hypothetical protein ABIV50_15515 [Opitutus sp.]